jgi:hypothetical protein
MIAGTAPDLEIRYGNGRISPPVHAEMQRYAKQQRGVQRGKSQRKMQPDLRSVALPLLFQQSNFNAVSVTPRGLKEINRGLTAKCNTRPGCAISPFNAVAPDFAT